MPQTLKPLCLIHFLSWENSLFWLLALWGNKNGLPGMKVQNLKICLNKSDSTGCKWSSLNVPGTEAPLSPPFLELGVFFFLSLFWKLKVIQQWFNGDASKDFMFEPRLTVALSFFTIFSLLVLAAFSAASAVCRLAPTYLSLSVTSRGWSAALFTV